MAITFHCNYCNRRIEAKEEAAGKWGKCPSCHNKIYVPNLDADTDDLKLAPLDETNQRQEQQLMAETYTLEQQILSERATESNDNDQEPVGTTPVAGVGINEDDVYETIVKYLRYMADGDLREAEAALRLIKAAGEIAVKCANRIAMADIPEADLSDIPQQVLAGLIRNLRQQIE